MKPSNSIPAITLRQVCTYRGVGKGWQSVGQPRQLEEAADFLALLKKVRPDFSSKMKPA